MAEGEGEGEVKDSAAASRPSFLPSRPLASLAPDELGRALHRRLLRIFAVASGGTILCGLIFFVMGLDFSWFQRRIVLFVIMPLSLLPMIGVELWAIRLQVRPIQAFLRALAARGEEEARPLAGPALVRALNLPLLAALRVLFIHAPSFAVPVNVLVYLANEYLYLDLGRSPFLMMWATLIIFTAGHAIYEYFAVASASRPIVPLLRRHAGDLAPDLAARVIPLGMKRKLLLVFFFVAVVPVFSLGATVLLKVQRTLVFLRVPDVEGAMAPIEAWVLLLFAGGCAVTLILSALLAREVSEATGALVRAMKRVESGDLDGRLEVTTTDEFADLYDGFNRMTSGLAERERLRDAFGRYVAPEVADAIMQHGSGMSGGTVRASVMFADIRGFTEMSERMRPSEVVSLLNVYFAAVEPAIRAEGGFINKFGGDSLLAVFGAPVSYADHAARAVRAALGMRKALSELNAARQRAGEAPLRIGVGISSGEMVAGSIGSPDRMEYTVIGDVVNVASRIEALNKEWDTDILVSEDTLTALPDPVQSVPMPPTSVKGKSAKLKVFSI